MVADPNSTPCDIDCGMLPIMARAWFAGTLSFLLPLQPSTTHRRWRYRGLPYILSVIPPPPLPPPQVHNTVNATNALRVPVPAITRGQQHPLIYYDFSHIPPPLETASVTSKNSKTCSTRTAVSHCHPYFALPNLLD